MVPDGVQVYTSTGVGAGGLQYPTGADAVFFSVEFCSFSPHFSQFQKHFKMSFLFFSPFFSILRIESFETPGGSQSVERSPEDRQNTTNLHF